jgi:hypothetical protein
LERVGFAEGKKGVGDLDHFFGADAGCGFLRILDPGVVEQILD